MSTFILANLDNFNNLKKSRLVLNNKVGKMLDKVIGIN